MYTLEKILFYLNLTRKMHTLKSRSHSKVLGTSHCTLNSLQYVGPYCLGQLGDQYSAQKVSWSNKSQGITCQLNWVSITDLCVTHRFTQIIRKIAYNIKYTVKCQNEHTTYTCNVLHLQQRYAVKTGIINPNICAIWKRGSLSSQYMLQGLETSYEHISINSLSLNPVQRITTVVYHSYLFLLAFQSNNISTWCLTSQTVFIVYNSRNNVGPRLSDSSTCISSKHWQTSITINAQYKCITLHQCRLV